ncbi:hypothetical protein ACFX5F_14115 [Flavobacterium sp. ZS1P70]|uniref:Lipoprotein n=1 Tax=Flavobacterium zhoui TaxID=3230414 RepID=A0ABW6I834_9FLAO
MKSAKNTVILTICLLVLSCNTYKRDPFYFRSDSKYKDESFWIDNFKDEVFYACLKEGYKNDSIFKLMGKKDLFNASEVFDFSEMDSARVLGRKIIKKMPPPFIHIDDKDITGMNFISAACLHYYASRELDSIAKEAYKKHAKMAKENNKF